MSIENLFQDDDIEIQQFQSLISGSAEDYSSDAVISITHVRDLWSSDRHEFLEVVIENQDTGNRSRLIAERLNGQDQVSLSPWGGSNFGYLSSSRSPLPLFSVTFNSGDLMLLDFVKMLTEINNIAREYDLLSGNSYWFAITAYNSLKLRFYGREERFSFFKWRGRLVIFKKSAQVVSDEFENERNCRMRWAPGHPAPAWEFLEEVYKAVIRLTSSSEEECEENLEENLTTYIMRDLDEKRTLGVMEDADYPASMSSDLDLDRVYQHAKGLHNASDYVDSFNEQEENVDGIEDVSNDAILIPEDFEALEPIGEEVEKIKYVVQVMAGQALHEF